LNVERLGDARRVAAFVALGLAALGLTWWGSPDGAQRWAVLEMTPLGTSFPSVLATCRLRYETCRVHDGAIVRGSMPDVVAVRSISARDRDDATEVLWLFDWDQRLVEVVAQQLHESGR
jgi:hypothetical protein